MEPKVQLVSDPSYVGWLYGKGAKRRKIRYLWQATDPKLSEDRIAIATACDGGWMTFCGLWEICPE